MLGKRLSSNLMVEQPGQLSLLIEIRGHEEFLVGIKHPFRTDKANQNDRTIQPTMFQSNQETRWRHNDRD